MTPQDTEKQLTEHNDELFHVEQSDVPPATPPTLRRLFLGDDGLRAGWSIVLFLLLAAALIFALQYTIIHLHLVPPPTRPGPHDVPHDLHPRGAVIGEFLSFTGFALAAWVMSLIERRPFARYGLAAKRMLPDFFIGLFFGLLSLSLLISALLLTHNIAFHGVALHGEPALLYAAKWAIVFLLVGLFEEFFFRGYLQYTLARGVAGIVRAMDASNRHANAISFGVSASLFSVVLFTLAHTGNQGETFSGIFAVGLAGAVFAFSLWRTGSLWWAIGFHTAWDWAQSFFYGTPDSGARSFGHFLNSQPIGNPSLSGGSAGPEGSLLVIPTLLFVALVIHFTLPYRARPLTSDQTAPIAPPDYEPLLPDQLG